MIKKPTQLTKDGIKNLLEKNFKNSIFQIVEMNHLPPRNNMPTTTSEKPTEKYKVTISDGFAQFKTFFASEACKMIISGAVKNFCIFEAVNAVINITDKTMVIIVKINVVYDTMSEIIGKPMEFDEYLRNNFQNPNGSSIIPQYVNKANEEPAQNPKLESFTNKFGKPNPTNGFPSQNGSMNSHGQLNSNGFGNSSAGISNQNAGKAFSVMNKFQNLNNQTKNDNLFNKQTNTGFNQAGSVNSFSKNYDEDSQNLMTIAMLSPVCDPNWKIKARILKKGDIRQYKTAKGEGCFFTLDIMDRNLTEISCSFFNAGCEKWFDFLNEGSVYVFSGGLIKENNSRYNTKNDYQITFDDKANITLTKEDGSILRQKFVFVKLNQVAELPVGNFVDIIAIVKDPGESAQITLKSGDVKTKRSLVIYDDSNSAIELTLWGDLANKEFNAESIVVIKQARIGEFNSTRNLSNGFNSQFISECEEIPEFKALFSWQKSNEGKDLNIPFMSSRSGPSTLKFKSLAKMEEEATQKLIDANEKVFSDVKAFLVFIKNSETTTLYYLSCPTEKCMRKVVEDSDGWRCEKCNRTYPEPLARYIISAKISDDTGSVWVSIYDPTASLIIGKSANEIKILKEQGQIDIINNFFKNLQYVEYRMKILSKMEIYNGETRIKHQILRIFPNDFSLENKNALAQLGKFYQK